MVLNAETLVRKTLEDWRKGKQWGPEKEEAAKKAEERAAALKAQKLAEEEATTKAQRIEAQKKAEKF